MAVTLRVAEETHEILREVSESRGVPITQLLADLADRLQREELLRKGNEAYARLREDPEAWAEELEERRLWDTTLMDGLEDDPPWED